MACGSRGSRLAAAGGADSYAESAQYLLQEAAGHVQPNELGPQVVMELAFQKTTCQVGMHSAHSARSAAWGS